MPADPDRLDRLYQYALIIASGADDYRERDLGPIQLLKYAYLADVAYAANHNGQTYTGYDWRFFHFGPWNEAAHARIVPAVERLGAQVLDLRSRDGDPFVRFSLRGEDIDRLAEPVRAALPREILLALSREVREHGNNTASLLRHVYVTPPMLQARPNELLDFSSAVAAGEPVSSPATSEVKRSTSDKKRRKTIIDEARSGFQRLAATRRSAPVTPAPRYDDVFYRGTAELDRLAGESVPTGNVTVEFGDSVWHSDQRRGPDVS